MWMTRWLGSTSLKWLRESRRVAQSSKANKPTDIGCPALRVTESAAGFRELG